MSDTIPPALITVEFDQPSNEIERNASQYLANEMDIHNPQRSAWVMDSQSGRRALVIEKSFFESHKGAFGMLSNMKVRK